MGVGDADWWNKNSGSSSKGLGKGNNLFKGGYGGWAPVWTPAFEKGWGGKGKGGKGDWKKDRIPKDKTVWLGNLPEGVTWQELKA
eukprot:CAMPEP_0179305970 /NCGR_PEP_ID=MMETSP0797-20121207/49890_1 /TAXON_ID=47934 /ORGANISM="Dinophysis acuminata, Strain DAEP01" /LENGTH=84 /DNA_ID=CAMNT_0021015619 /DNA_START=59 /DNA_END=309 /DNA_ORIENTATION=+